MPRIPVSAPATQIYFPAAYGHPSVSITNIGAANIFVNNSGAGTVGLLLQPNDQMTFPHGVYPIYGVAAGVTTGTSITTNAAYGAGQGTFVLSATGTALGTGATVQLGTANSAEFLTIATIATSTVTTVGLSVLDHASGAPMALVTAVAGSSVHVEQVTG